MSELSVNHLLGIKYINKNDIDLIFETADHFKEVINRPIKKVPSLRDITIANIFFENSTRTKLSFELAQKRLSADVISFSAAQSSVKKGETWERFSEMNLGSGQTMSFRTRYEYEGTIEKEAENTLTKIPDEMRSDYIKKNTWESIEKKKE